MGIETDRIYPHCPTIIRKVEAGGLTKSQLLQKLEQHSILINKLGENLFANDNFTTSDKTYSLKTVELNVRDLGFPEGATMPQLFKKATQLGLKLCPLELGPHLRMNYLDQPEGHSGKPSQPHQAPYGSITVASEILSEDDDVPKGFYLRRIEGVLWLRGYVADHLRGADDRFIFCQ